MSGDEGKLWRDLLSGPSLAHAVRVRFARRVVGRLLGPLWLVVLVVVPVTGALLMRPVPIRWLPLAPAVAGLVLVTWLRHRQRWMASASALSATLFVSVTLAVLLSGVHAPMYQVGFVVLALVVSLFGTRWASITAGALFAVGLASVGLTALQLRADAPPPPAAARLVLYTFSLVLSLVVLGGIQRMLGEALEEARRRRREAIAAREAEQASELAFQAVFDQASVGMVLLGAQGAVAQLNRRAADWLGGTEPWIGRLLARAPLWNREQQARLEAAIGAAADGRASRLELTVQGPHGAPLNYQVNVAPFQSASQRMGRVIVEIVEVSDLVRTRTMLAQARRLEALGKLSGGVAHDINNMLAAIQGATDLLRQSEDARRVATSRDLIQASVSRASALTKQLLAFGRQDRFETTDVDVNRLAAELGRLFERTLAKNIAIRVVTTETQACVRGDRAALENALLNLALNAQDAMPNGGTLSVSVEVVELDQAASARLGGAPPAGRAVVIEVRDTGTGMTEGVRERIFEPFFTTKPVGKGTGLGLPAVHGTVRNHHGAVAVESQPGDGTAFRIYLPASEPAGRSSPVPHEPPTPLRFEARLLVADDEPLVRQALAGILELAGCDVEVVESGEALIDRLADGASPDLIVTDLGMPGLSGAKLVQGLELMRPGLPLLLVTGFTGDDVSMALSGRTDYRLLRKPIAEAELLEALRQLLPGHAQVRETRARIA